MLSMRFSSLVQTVIKEITTAYSDKFKLVESQDRVWEISPKRPGAASVRIDYVDDSTIYITVDDLFWLEMFHADKELMNHLEAILNGKITGWYDPSTLNKQHVKTLLEVDAGSKHPHRWYTNILFPGWFKKRRGVIKKQYKPYV